MTYNEFVELNGEYTAEVLVQPLKDSQELVPANNANIFTHLEIKEALKFIGLEPGLGLNHYDHSVRDLVLQLVNYKRKSNEKTFRDIAGVEITLSGGQKLLLKSELAG